MDKDPDFRAMRSSTSCNVDDIQGIMLGGNSSRFWMLRKHFNSLKQDDLKNMPFYCWECLTIQLHNRDVDLVIRDQYQMDQFLTYLIHNMRTMDGKKGTAEKILAAMFK